jgi:diguanylate cyclase (GGDEF)-like protein/PAS domain S-box-containing protein
VTFVGNIYKECLKNSPIAYGYHKLLLDSQGRPCDYIFIDVNPAFEKMTGLVAKNIIGKKVTEVLPDIINDQFDWINFYGEITLKKEKREFEQYSNSLDRYYKVIVFSPQDHHFITLFYDITKERKIINQLEEKQRIIKNISNKFEILFKNSLDAIVYFDKNHKVIDVNESFVKTFKYKKEECIGKNLDDLIIIKNKREEAEKITFELFQKNHCELEGIRYTKDGQPIFVNIKGILHKEGDQIVGGYAIYTNITEKVNYQKSLESMNEELEATISQLTVSKEELKAQYDEIQGYLDKNAELSQKYQIAINSTNSLIWEVDKDYQKILYMSENVKDILGEEVEEKNIYEIIEKVVYPEDREKLISEIVSCKNRIIDEINVQVRLKDKYGTVRWYLVKGKEVKDRFGNVKTVSGIFYEITDLKTKEEYIQYVADHDFLTGLYNRRKFTEVLTEQLNKGEKGTLILFDIDNFKDVNDTLGHVYGDKLLNKIALTLKKIECENCDIFRLGGDEFLLLVKGEEDVQEIEKYIGMILNNFYKRIKVDKIERPISASIGICSYPKDGTEIDELLKKVDIAMYKAKETGKNKYLFFSEEMQASFNKKVEIDNLLRKALKSEGFVLNYQPIIDGNTGKVISFEALLRLKDIPISPAIFIPVAEERGLIIPLGRWVIKEVIRQLKEWRDKGLELKPVAINLSPKQFYDDNLLQYLEKKITENNLDPSLIEIEITENVLVENKDENIKVLHKLKKLGVSIALDDFGTGYSSLNYLTFMPINKIKLDKSLKDKFIEQQNIQIIGSIISIAHSLNLKVVAEGVENSEEYQELKKLSCDYMQGYLFSKPLIAEEAEKIFSRVFTGGKRSDVSI